MRLIGSRGFKRCSFILFRLQLSLTPTQQFRYFRRTKRRFFFHHFTRTLTSRVFCSNVRMYFVSQTRSRTRHFPICIQRQRLGVMNLIRVKSSATNRVHINVIILVCRIVSGIRQFRLIIQVIVPIIVRKVRVTRKCLTIIFMVRLPFLLVLLHIFLRSNMPAIGLIGYLMRRFLLYLTVRAILFHGFIFISRLCVRST